MDSAALYSTARLPLAQASGFVQVLIWSLVLIAALLAMFLGVAWLRRWMASDAPDAEAGFTLADLRDMHKTGRMTTEEFEKAKALLVKHAGKPRDEA